MAEGLVKHRYGDRVYVDSVGVRVHDVDPFAVATMAEIGVDLSRHRPKAFGELQDTSFDYIVSLSPSAQHRAVELTRTMACELLFWHTLDATALRGNRDTILQAYRSVRDSITARIDGWLPPVSARSTDSP